MHLYTMNYGILGEMEKIVDHDINDWINMIEKLGVNWNTTRAGIPNLLSEGLTGIALRVRLPCSQLKTLSG